MQWFLTLRPGMQLLVAVGVALALLVGLGYAWAALRRWRFARAAVALGLALTKEGSIRGARDELTIRVAHERRQIGTVRSRTDRRERRPVHRWFTEVTVTLPRGLPHGLQIEAVGALGRLAASVSDQPEWTLGARDVERAYEFEAAGGKLEAARETLRQPEVLDALRGLRDVPFDFRLAGSEMILERRGRIASLTKLRAAVDGLVRLGRALIDVQPRVHAQSAEAVCARDWVDVATAHGLDLRGTTMDGRLGRATFSMVSELVGAERETRLALAFDLPLCDRLALAPAGTGDRLRTALGAHDLRTGDAAFDARFQIEGAPPEAVMALLSPGVRAGLTVLVEQGELTMDAERVALRVPRLVAGDAVGLLVGGFATLAAELGAPSDGPFR